LHCLGDHGHLVTRVGRDEYGPMTVLRMAELGLDTEFVQWDDRWPTGSINVKLDPEGDRDDPPHPHAAYDVIEPTYELMELATTTDALCFGTLALRNAGSRGTLQRLAALAPDRPRLLDLNLRQNAYSWRGIEEALGLATLLKLNEDEARRVAFGCDMPPEPLPDFCRGLLNRFRFDVCVITLAERGAYAATTGSDPVYEPGYEVPVADTCGVGEAFAAGFLHAHLRRRSLREACRLGNQFGALVATLKGATEPVTRTLLESLAAANLPRIRDPQLLAWAGD
jgi:fructokinase